jgi:hypothetical protein
MNKKKVDLLIKKGIRNKDFVNELNKKMSKQEFCNLMNDKKYCKKIILNLLYKMSDNDMWQKRAEMFMSILIDSLFVLTKKLKLSMTVPLISHNLNLDSIIMISEHLNKQSLSENFIEEYLNKLPNYNNGLPNYKAYECHGFVTMQFTEILKYIKLVMNLPDCENYTQKIIIIDKINNF